MTNVLLGGILIALGLVVWLLDHITSQLQKIIARLYR